MGDYSSMNMTAQRILNHAFDVLVENMISRDPGEAEIETHVASGELKCEASWKSSDNEMHFRILRRPDA